MAALFVNIAKSKVSTALTIGIFYAAILASLIVVYNNNSMIYYKISPYAYASEPIDFFFSLIVSIPFAIHTFFLKKDHFLDYAALRTSKRKYIFAHVSSLMALCFLMVFIVNIIGIFFSLQIASVVDIGTIPSLNGYILADMQVESPLFFGLIWAAHKAFVGTLICLFAQILALYIDNMFFALLAPFAYVQLENFFTSIFGISRYSLTTTFVLNRLSPEAMKIQNITISVLVFGVVILCVAIGLYWYGKKHE